MSQDKDWARQYDAPLGKIWVCKACGKYAQNRADGGSIFSYGWDESCFLNAVLCDDEGVAEEEK